MEQHLYSIEETIQFLTDYKALLKSQECKYTNNMEILLSNSDLHLHRYMETLYEIIDCTKNGIPNNNLQELIAERTLINNNIKEVMPLILYHFANKLPRL